MKKINLSLIGPIVVPTVCVYLGYSFGSLYGRPMSPGMISYTILHPFPIRITPWTYAGAVSGLFIALVLLVQLLLNPASEMHGAEFGSARIAEPEEITQEMADEDIHMNKILSENVRISLNTRKTGINNNVLILGASGTGKTFYEVKPNAYNLESSYIFCDPKGELLRDTGNYLRRHGYHLIVLNLVDFDQSDGYNPFAYIRSDEDITKLITNLIENTTPKNSTNSQPFWDKAESMYLQAIMLYVWYEFPKQGKTSTIRGMMDLLNMAKVPNPKDPKAKPSPLDIMMNELPPDHPALVTYKKVMSGAADTIRSVLISAHARLAKLQNPRILRILDHDDMDIAALGEGIYRNPDRKTAIFCVTPDNDNSYNFLVGMLYTQIFQELYFTADHKYGGRLPVHVSLWMDEFANVALPDSFTEILATCRSREISCNIIIQNMAQLKAIFKDSWETIPGNCDVLVYLGGNEESTFEYISKLLGKKTINKYSLGVTSGSHGSSSKNTDSVGRDLMMPDEVRKLENAKCLIFVRGRDPVLDDKYRTMDTEEFQEAEELGPYEHEGSVMELQNENCHRYYFDVEGDRVEDSYQYQTEHYHGVFEEAAFYETLVKTEEGFLVPDPEQFIGYQVPESGVVVYPAFESDLTETVLSGGEVMRRHPIVGVFDPEIDSVDEVDSTFIADVFCEARRADSLQSSMEMKR